MARFIPLEPGRNVQSAAERRLFPKFAALSDEWTVLHSVGLTRHRRKKWAEADFVLVGPSGVFVLEVKGGRIERRDGQWRFTNRDGHTESKREGPFEQAGGAAGALQRFLRDLARERPAFPSMSVGWGVMFPDIAFTQVGPDIEQKVVFDASNASSGIPAFVERLVGHWQSSGGWERRELPKTQREAVVAAIRGDFDFQPRLADRARHAREELIRLTEEQADVVAGLQDSTRLVVRGYAGTGKTVLAVEHAKMLAKAEKSVLLTCYNTNLATYLERCCADEPRITVRHLHGLMSDVLDVTGGKARIPQGADSDSRFRTFYPILTADALLADPTLLKFDAVVIDEGQDLLTSDYADVLDLIIEGGIKNGEWSLFLDAAQDLFTGLDRAVLRRFVDSLNGQYRLVKNCRNTEPIAVFTSAMSGQRWEVSPVEGPDVDRVFFGDPSECRRAFAKQMSKDLSGGVGLDEIVVLSPVTLSKSILNDALPGLEVPLRDRLPSDGEAIGNRSIAFSTVSSFKGLEADVVHLVDVHDLSADEARALMYVACSRARFALHVYMPTDLEESFNERWVEFVASMAGGQLDV